ncbi:efflux RND transporter permease subunit, partial [Escherichia ruysiae]
DIQTPATASSNRTDEVLAQATQMFQQNEAVENTVAIRGFSFSGQGPNAGLMFVTFKDWAEREQSAQDIANAANMQMFGYQDAQA